jgi:hypothetical protein
VEGVKYSRVCLYPTSVTCTISSVCIALSANLHVSLYRLTKTSSICTGNFHVDCHTGD